MKLVSIFFTASAENLRVYRKDVKYLYIERDLFQKLYEFLKNIFFIEIRSFVSPFAHICHHSCRGGVGPPKKQRKITKQQDLSCWSVAKHLKNREIIITVVGAGSARPKNDAR